MYGLVYKPTFVLVEAVHHVFRGDLIVKHVLHFNMTWLFARLETLDGPLLPPRALNSPPAFYVPL